jgi:hypothetical protein
MKNKPKNIPSPYKFAGTKIFRDTTALPFVDGGPLRDRNITSGKLLQSTYASALGNMFREGGPFGENKGAFDYATSVYAPELGNYYNQGGLIKRADGSYSQRGLWDNIRANAGSGKKPTAAMLAQEKKINNTYRTGGQFPTPYSLPEDSFKQGGRNLHNSIYASSSAQYPAVYKNGGGMSSHFYASNVPDNNISNKDLTYPENSYVYAQGGDLNNFQMNKYPDVTNLLRLGNIPPNIPIIPPGGGETKGKPTAIPLSKLSVNDTTALIYNTVLKNIEKAKAEGRIGKDERLDPMGVTAQILLESGNAKSGLTSKYNNFGGLRATPGFIEKGGKTVEMLNKASGKKFLWRAYDTPEEGLAAQVDFYLNNPRYRKAGVFNAASPKEHLDAVYKAGYAGKEKGYVDSVMRMVNSIPNRLKKANSSVLSSFQTAPAPATPTPEELQRAVDLKVMQQPLQQMQYLRPQLIPATTKGTIPEYEGLQAPSYGADVPLKDRYGFIREYGRGKGLYRWGNKHEYTPIVPKIVQEVTGFDKDAMLGYSNSEGDYIPGEIESAQNANRRIDFQGAGSLQDIRNQNAYNKEYDQYEQDLEKQNFYQPLAGAMGNILKREGGSIHINPANKGKFTASANAAGMGVQEFASHVLANKDNYSSTQVKRANFAHNAAGWKHQYGGHIMAAGGWPPGLKMKNPLLFSSPYYSNLTSGVTAPSWETGIQGQMGKKKRWTVSPHIGFGYNTPEGKFPLSGGLDLSYKGLPSPNRKGFATVDLSAGYNPAQGAGIGFDAGYKYRLLGQSNKRLGEIPAGKAALDLMPYGGAHVYTLPDDAGGDLIYGVKGEAQWRPKIFKRGVNKAPITFYGRGDLNFGPAMGKNEEKASSKHAYGYADYDPNTGALTATSMSDEGLSSGVKFKPKATFSGGMRMPLSRVGEYLSQRKGIPAVEGGEYYEETPNPGDFTFDQRAPTLNAKGNPIPGEYEEEIGDLNKRVKQWGANTVTPKYNANTETRMESGEFPFQQIDYSQPLSDEDEGYKYGGTMNFKYGGFNNPGFNALPKNVQAKIKARTFADGGTMPQLTEFNEGGRHEENPLGGIPQGTAGDGKVNLVEEGETKLNAANYIFSDSIKIDKGIAAAFNLAKSDIGKTFAEVSKRMNRPNSRRDNDTIEQNAKQRDLENLMLAQEGFKQIDLQKDIEMMQRKHPEMMEALQTAMSQQEQGQPAPEEMTQQGQPQMSPEEQEMMMAQQQGQMDPAMAEQMAMQQGGMPQEQMGQIPMSYGGSMFACGGKMYMDGGNLGAGMLLGSPALLANKMFNNGGNLAGSLLLGSPALLANKLFNNGGRMYPNGGGLPTNTYNPNWTVVQDTDAPVMNLQNLRYTYPTDARDEPIYGSRDEAKKALLNNPESDISRTYYQDRGTGKMGQLLTNAAVQDIKGGINQSWSPNFSNLPIKLKDEDTFNMTDYYYKHDATPYSGPYGVEPGLEHMSNPQYMNGGRMYGKGGQVLRSIGAGAYGVGEGLLDTLTMGATDSLTDKGYDALAGIGNRSEQDLERDRMIRGFGNTAGAIGGAIVSGGAATGSAISEGAEGLGEGLTNIKGTNKAFDDTVNSLAKVGSMAGGLVGGNPAESLGGAAGAAKGAAGTVQGMEGATNFAPGTTQIPQFAQTMMKASQNPFLQQVTGMAGSMMHKNGGHMYPTYYPSYKNNAGPIGQELTNTQIYNYGGGLGDPDKDRGPSKDAPKQVYNLPQVEKYYQFNPFVFPGMPTPTKGSGLSKEEKASLQILPSTTNPLTEDQRARMYGEKFKYGGSFENPRQQMYMPLDNVERMGGHLYAAGGEMDGGEPKININGKLYTKDEAIQAANKGIIASDPMELASYFAELETSTPINNTPAITPGQEEDQDEEIYPGASNENIITGGKGDYSEEGLTDEILIAEQMVKNAKNPKDKKEAQEYLSELKRADMALKDRNVNLGMKQTPLQALGLAAPAAYNIGMGLFGKPSKLNQEDFKNKSKVTPYKANIYPQLNEANLAYNSAERALKDMSPGAGAYLTNRSNLANNRAKAISSILANKENVDAQTQMQADLQNAQINANNMGNKLAIEQFNAQSKAAKQNMLGKGLEQLGQMAQNSGAMDAQERYMQLISPQYGKTFEYKTIFDQATDALKNYRKNKNSKSEENI